MRDIIFRGKRKDNGEWVCSRSIIEQKTENGEKEIFMPQVGESNLCTVDENNNLICIENCIFYKVIPETVGQYTGLTDKNGKKIFEGDLMTCRDGRLHIVKIGEFFPKDFIELCSRYGTLRENYELLGNLYGVYAESISNDRNKGKHFVIPKKTVAEVIGNIHDNPELLKGGADNA